MKPDAKKFFPKKVNIYDVCVRERYVDMCKPLMREGEA